jgi:hypothetical protein
MHGELLLYLYYPETLVRRRARAGPTEARESISPSPGRPHAVIEAKEVRRWPDHEVPLPRLQLGRLGRGPHARHMTQKEA